MSAMTMEPDQAPQGAARVGMEMRLVRERLGWRLADVAAELRIRLPYLEAIERGELSALPGAAYQTGFVRTYSQALGLDGDEILRRFRAEGTGFVPKAELSFLAPVPDRAVPTGAIVLVGVVAVLVGYGLWYRHTAQEAQLAAQIPNVPTELAPLAVPPKPPEAAAPPKIPAPATAPPAGAAPGTAPASPTGSAAVMPASPAATSPGGTSSNPTSSNPASSNTGSATPAAAPAPAGTPPTTATATAQPAATSSAPAAAAAAASGRIIEATGDDWVEVQDSKGNILFSKTLHAGDSWPVPDLPGLVMTAGNAGATLIAENGKPGAPLGGNGAVIRKFPLTQPATEPATQAATPAAPKQTGAATGTPIGAPTGTVPVEGPSPTAPGTTN